VEGDEARDEQVDEGTDDEVVDPVIVGGVHIREKNRPRRILPGLKRRRAPPHCQAPREKGGAQRKIK
jgi:hypothetical protein